jgi:hypothetical protein
MSDLIEQRLRELFAADAVAAPQPADLLARTERAARARRRRAAGWGLAAGVVAVAIVATSFWPAPELVPFPHVAAPPTSPVRGPGTISATPGYGPGTRLSLRPVVQVLDAAADTAAKAPDVVPAPGQFLYTRDVGRDGRVLSERWLSIDGAHDGLGFTMETNGNVDRFPLPGCRDGAFISGIQKGEECEPMPAYLPDLPTDADAMARYLDLNNRHLDNDPAQNKTNGVGKNMLELAAYHYLRPAQRAALYQAAARIDGISVVENAVDAAGRTGTGVTWTFSEHTTMWIFDPKSHGYLGSDRATTEQAIVDQVGQRPGR